ncbi:MAG TPA: hypothetical protein VHP33_29970 [Polyangiaceae bacterium]|nr:hypothetical protein [Polyangiaceae bacterium]
MRLRPRHYLPVFAAPLLASCVFLLDYDELQGGNANGAGGMPASGGQPEGGTPNQVGEAGNAGAGAGASPCGVCDDQDPCTTDSCDGDACVHEALEGLALDGLDVSLPNTRHVRVSLAASGTYFYFSVLQVANKLPQIALYRLASDGAELEPLSTEGLEGIPVSNIGLAVEELALGEVALHGFLAAEPKLGDIAPKVFHLVHRDGNTTANLVGASYKADNEYVFPQAVNMGGSIVGAWIQPDGTIAVHSVGSARSDVFGAATLPATTLSLLATADDKPAVLFTAQSAPGAAMGTYIETSGSNRAKLAECETRPGDYLSSSVIATQVPGLYLANTTRYGDDYLTSGGGAILCGNNACAPLPESCDDAEASAGIRNVAGAAVHFKTDDPGIVYSVVAVPQIAVKDDGSGAEGRLSLALGRADFSAPGEPQSNTIGGDASGLLQVAQNDTSEALGFAGPDWPAVGILPSERVAVAWIQPGASGTGTDLHVQRYKMCLPPQ